MGKSAPSAPQAPDPAATSAAQTQSNQQTALYNFGLNNPNYNTPLGGISYTQTGGLPSVDQAGYDRALAGWQAGGSQTSNPLGYNEWAQQNSGTHHGRSAYDTYVSGFHGGRPDIADYTTAGGNPQFTANVRLSPEQQQLYNQQTQQSIGLSNLANQLQGRVGDTLNQPAPGSADFATTAKNAQDAYYANQKQYLDPQWDQQKSQNDAMLANQGIAMGSEAYNTAQNNFGRQRQSAYDTAQQNAILQGPQNAQQLFSLSSAARELPLNEFNALRSQSQVQMPQFAPTQGANAQPTNTSQNAWNAYGAQQNAYNQQVAGQNNQMNSLFGLGGQLGAAWMMSDIRLKTAIKPIKQVNGFWLYHFKYLGDDTLYQGVMAQDVQLLCPEAVVKMDNGFLAVDYARIGMVMERVH